MSEHTTSKRTESQPKLPPLPEPDQYLTTYENLRQQERKKNKLFAPIQSSSYTNKDIKTYNQANKKYHKTKTKAEKMEQDILTHPNVVLYQKTLVILTPDTDRNGKPLIKIGAIYQKRKPLSTKRNKLDIHPGQVFTGNLSNAPQKFRKIVKESFLRSFADNTFDLSVKYKDIPYKSGPIPTQKATASSN